MAETSYGPVAVWAAVLAIGAVTFCLRLSFLALFGRVDDVPPRLERALRFVPAAVLSALVVPALVTVEASAAATLLDRRLLAGAVAGAVAWRTEDVFATIAAGMVALWTLSALPL
jgi:branched-subunit amino acid transport protein